MVFGEGGRRKRKGVFLSFHMGLKSLRPKMSIHVCLADVESLIPSHYLQNRCHVANHTPSHQTNAIRTKIKMINICSDRLKRLVTSETKIQMIYICRD